MKRKTIILIAVLLSLSLVLGGCGSRNDNGGGEIPGTPSSDIGDSDDSFGDDLENSDIFDGYFEGERADVTITCVSGTEGAYTVEGTTVTFGEISEDSVYSITGSLRGNIIVDVGDSFKFDLEMNGFSIVSDSVSPITVLSGNEVSLTAKKGSENYVYDERKAVDENDIEAHSAAIYAETDLEICGKGSLTVISANNNGIHTKDDLQVKNLELFVSCADNALKGNDSVEIESGKSTLIATKGDGIKTSGSDVSEKGNQRGTVSITGGEHTVYAACDGIDAAYNVEISGEGTVLKIYTDKYSNYSEEVTAVDGETYYIRFTSNSYQYSVQYYNSDEDTVWVNAEYHSTASGGRNNYYYYSFPKMADYARMKLFIYSSDMEQGQDTEYLVASEYLTLNDSYDTFALTSRGGSLTYSWTNYTTNIQDGFGGMGGPGGFGGGPGGGMNDGNPDKGEYSTKGIKAANEINISGGSITVKSYDDAIHANADTALENGETPVGNVNVSGGSITVYSNDDGLHADGRLTVSGGSLCVTSSYEGLEGAQVSIDGGDVSVISSDDGVNATATSGNGVTVSGGRLYVYAGGDGIDSNSRDSYVGIVFSGGNTVVISTSGGNSAIDTERGYSYTGGYVLAVMPSGGMTSESINCQSFNSVGTKASVSVSSGAYLAVSADGAKTVSVRMPKSISGTVIFLGSNSASISTSASADGETDPNGVAWHKSAPTSTGDLIADGTVI